MDSPIGCWVAGATAVIASILVNDVNS